MIKKMLIIVAGVILLVLTACSTGGGDEAADQTANQSSDQASGESGLQDDKVRLSEDYDDALAVQAQLALGSLKLEDTELAIDEALAAELLPLWQAHQSLSNSDTTAEVELTAVLNQIQDTMSPEQLAAIAAMELTSEDVTATIEEMGETLGPGAFRGGVGFGDNPGGGPGGFGGGPGGFGEGPGGFGGGPGGLGGGPGSGPGGLGQLSENERATRIAEQFGDQDVASIFTQRILTNILITTLQLKTGELDAEELREQAEQAGQRLDPVAIVAEVTGLEAEALLDEMAEGSTLAQVITALGGDLESAKAALLEAYKGMPASEEQDVEGLVDNILNRSYAFSRGSGGE